MLKSIQIHLDVIGNPDRLPPGIKPFFERAEQPFNPTILPGAKGIGGLLAGAEDPEAQAHDARVEKYLIVRSQKTRLAETLDSFLQQTQNPDAGSIAQAPQAQQPLRSMTHNPYHRRCLLTVRSQGDVASPDLIQ
jgi:hypothetical protein